MSNISFHLLYSTHTCAKVVAESDTFKSYLRVDHVFLSSVYIIY